MPAVPHQPLQSTIEIILKGKTTKLVKSLKMDMAIASDKLEFERAMELRNQIDAIQWLNERQHMERQKKYDEDIINYLVKNDRVYLILFNKQEFEFAFNPDFFEEFIIQYYSENPVPRELILPKKLVEVNSLTSYLKLKRAGAVSIKVPQKGEKK